MYSICNLSNGNKGYVQIHKYYLLEKIPASLLITNLAKLAILDNIREYLNCPGYVLGEALGIEDSLLTGSVGIQVCTHVFHLQLQISLGSLCCSLSKMIITLYTSTMSRK